MLALFFGLSSSGLGTVPDDPPQLSRFDESLPRDSDTAFRTIAFARFDCGSTGPTDAGRAGRTDIWSGNNAFSLTAVMLSQPCCKIGSANGFGERFPKNTRNPFSERCDSTAPSGCGFSKPSSEASH